MKILTRSMIPALAACCTLAASGAQASHDRDHCKGDVEAKVVVPGVGPAALDYARHGAVHAWKEKVAHKYGWAYARWSAAEDRDIDCDTHHGNTKCEAEAEPCH